MLVMLVKVNVTFEAKHAKWTGGTVTGPDSARVRDKARGDCHELPTFQSLQYLNYVSDRDSPVCTPTHPGPNFHFSILLFLCLFSIQFPGVQPPLAPVNQAKPNSQVQVHDGALSCPPPIAPHPDQSSPSWNDRAATRFDYLILIIFPAP